MKRNSEAFYVREVISQSLSDIKGHGAACALEFPIHTIRSSRKASVVWILPALSATPSHNIALSPSGVLLPCESASLARLTTHRVWVPLGYQFPADFIAGSGIVQRQSLTKTWCYSDMEFFAFLATGFLQKIGCFSRHELYCEILC